MKGKWKINEEYVEYWICDTFYYCTNKDGEGLFSVNLNENSRFQLVGTCDFSVYGLSDNSKKRKIRSYIKNRFNENDEF